MIFDWYSLFNLTEFIDADIPSRTLNVTLNGIGDREIIVCKGNGVSVLYEGVLLPVEFMDENPYVFEDVAVYLDDNDVVWLGIPVEE